MSERAKPMRWSRRNPDGRFITFKSHALRQDGEDLMIVSECKGGWYCYGLGINTASLPVASLDEAKAIAKAHAVEVATNNSKLKEAK